MLISPLGVESVNGSYFLSASLGDLVVTTSTNGSYALHQGFRQAAIGTVSTRQPYKENFEINLYPNPSVEYATLEWKKFDKDAFIKIIDMRGQVLNFNNSVVQSFSDKQEASLDLRSLPSGAYLILLHLPNNPDYPIVQRLLTIQK
jgi:hypothetical protein